LTIVNPVAARVAARYPDPVVRFLLLALCLAAAALPGCRCLGGSGEIRFPDAADTDAFTPPSDAGAGADGAALGSDAGVVHPENLPESLYAVAAVFADRKLWVIGGNDGCGAIDTVWSYDFSAPGQGWAEGPAMPRAAEFAAAATDGTRIYVGGGLDFGTRADDVLVLDIATQTWTVGPSFPSARSGLGAGWSGGLLLFIGGLDELNTPLDEVWALDPTDLTLAAMPAVAGGTAHHGAATWNDQVFVVSGMIPGNALTPDVRRFGAGGAWSPLAPLPIARKYSAGVALGDRIVVFGGALSEGEPSGLVDAYDPDADTWTALPSITPVATAAAVAIGDAIYLIGGLRTSGPTAEILVVERSW